MELEGEDAEDEILEDNSSMILQDDNEKTQLPDEWIYDLQLKNQSFLVKNTDSNSHSSVVSQQVNQGPHCEASQPTEKMDENGGDIAWTQPTAEDKEKYRSDSYLEKTKKVNKKQQWGPVIPSRRSSRLIHNGKTVLENAQDFKRKWNLEDNTENWMEKYGYSFLLNSWAPSELDSSVPGGQKGTTGWFPEESEDFSKDGVLATRHSRKRGGKLFRGVIADDPEVGFQAPGIHSMLLNSPSLPWWRALNDDLLRM